MSTGKSGCKQRSTALTESVRRSIAAISHAVWLNNVRRDRNALKKATRGNVVDRVARLAGGRRDPSRFPFEQDVAGKCWLCAITHGVVECAYTVETAPNDDKSDVVRNDSSAANAASGR